MRDKVMIGADVGGTHFRIGAADRNGDVRHFRKMKVEEIFRTEDVLGALYAFLEEYRRNVQETDEICGLAVGFPATVNKEKTTVLQAPNVAYMEDLPVVEYLTEKMGLPVWIDRDVCMTVCADKKMLGIGDCEILTACYFGTGIGNVICINGKPLSGRDGVAGELGHIPVDGSGELCGCGNVGCMENLAGGKYLAKLCREKFTGVPIGELFTRCSDTPEIRQFIDRMAMTVATEVNIVNPDPMIIGGGVPDMKNFPKELLEERIRFYTRKPYPERSLHLIFAENRGDKSVAGAALYAWDKYRG